MPAETHSQIASFIWSICNLLRGPYKRNEYRKVILPLTVLRRFDCILAPTKAKVLKEHAGIKTKGEDADNIIMGDTFTKDGFDRTPDGKKWTFDYMLANPPFGVEWKQQQKYVENEKDTLGHAGRFGVGTPRVNDGALLFLQHMLSKMRAPQDGGSRPRHRLQRLAALHW
jgi:type I restriction-modification system DNA methylase subunit